MRVTAKILFCEKVQITFEEGNVKPIVIGQTTSIVPFSLPGNYSFALYCSVEGLSASLEHKLRLLVYDPNGSTMYESGEVPIRPGAKFKTHGDCFGTIELVVDARNVIIPCIGIIKAILYVDGNEIISNELEVSEK